MFFLIVKHYQFNYWSQHFCYIVVQHLHNFSMFCWHLKLSYCSWPVIVILINCTSGSCVFCPNITNSLQAYQWEVSNDLAWGNARYNNCKNLNKYFCLYVYPGKPDATVYCKQSFIFGYIDVQAILFNIRH